MQLYSFGWDKATKELIPEAAGGDYAELQKRAQTLRELYKSLHFDLVDIAVDAGAQLQVVFS